MGTQEHKQSAPESVSVGIISVSSTRNLENDESGNWIARRAKKEGHRVADHRVVPDDAQAVVDAILKMIREMGAEAILITGGTGISPRDVTIEAVRPLFEKELTAFSPLFAQLSFEEIDSAALLSRATAGIFEKTVLFCMPGSLKACRLACKAIIFPELGHLIRHIRES
ncbi:MAG: molybdenum cofactor biosynthesis protein B [Thermodesulfobacteriota bacterium]